MTNEVTKQVEITPSLSSTSDSFPKHSIGTTLKDRFSDVTFKHNLLVFSLIIGYLLLIKLITPLRPDHAFLAIFMLTLWLGKAKQFARDWSVFIIAWVAYDAMRGIADNISGKVGGQWIYDLDVKITFGIFNNEPIPLWFQDHSNIFVTIIAGFFYSLHMVIPLLMAWIFWYFKSDDNDYYIQYWRFVVAFVVTSIIGVIIFVIHPVAPPWYYLEQGGFVSPPAGYETAPNAGLLTDVDDLIGFNVFTSFYETFESNPFAAFPSLHAGYAFLCAIISTRTWGKKARWVWIYPIGMSISAMYLNHHWMVDLFAGWLVAYVGVLISYRLVGYVTKRREAKSVSSDQET
ncbi:MAG: phosphatase PAP2 family protein [Candidatus Kariarchaeaceae archaeon]